MTESIENKKRELAGRGVNLTLINKQTADKHWLWHRRYSSIDEYYECPSCGAKFDDVWMEFLSCVWGKSRLTFTKSS